MALPLHAPVPFAAFMEEALYGAQGYYCRNPFPVGEAGDYVTGSSLSPLFGRTTARLLRRLDAALGRSADYLEAGFGGGAHLRHLATALEAVAEGARREGAALAALSPSESTVEVAPAPRRLFAWDRVPRPVPPGVELLAALEAIPERGLEGLIFSYELFDALPVHRLIGRADGSLGELWVERIAGDRGESAGMPPASSDQGGDSEGGAGVGAGGFSWREGELSDPALAGLLRSPDWTLQPGQIADLAPGWAPLYRDLARRLGRGLLVTCDYGFERERLLDPRVRMHGTLAAYTRQRVHRNPFVRVGEQDLTAHVDFTALIQAGEAEGLATFAFTRQSLWLAACGLFEELTEADRATRLEAMALLDGEGMGEEIRVLVQGRGVEARAVVGTIGVAK